MIALNRRCLLAAAGVQVAAATLRSADAAAQPAIGFGFGTYGMKSLKTAEAIRVCAEIGYDGVEFALMDGWPTAPELLSDSERAEIRRQLRDLGLCVPSLLHSLPCLRSDQQHTENLERLKRAVELAHDLAPEKPPVVQSIVAGKTDQWEPSKQRLVDQLSDWAEVGRASQTVVCFKPHAAHAVHTPERAWWVHGQVASPWLKVVYDYSHFSLEGLSLAESLKQLLPITAYVQIKDSRGTPAKHEYLLPGDGDTDYGELLSILKDSGYDGFVNVEVSSHVHRKPGYDPVGTANLCYDRLAPLFESAGGRC
ncbi:Inosose isomerase [Stieleria maiorica]|uniref:Inosose isomerase n=1 Tax=Stieleria maiorica TaxID=2795974 RepID=A0A5B9MLD6_9BACT|nr:sugar phosphate isomerase/epimerase [Stieleria maiorica]QEG00326.1 Inosose isomerase [Stieleria maiorica]